jgi:hypothetical protein
MGENKIKKPSMSFVALIKIYLQKIRGKWVFKINFKISKNGW